ncbi:MAG: chorismate synthase [Candidatus Limisoma sp.]|nr:chorismate synthase [Bacteroidales bacterium]MDY5893396.1 chorismate synthase [Candidatus Limisoma sp.]MDY5900666.1 chorismate synthase [Candidatus Limisoma sp.]
MNEFGIIYRLTSFGESHGAAVGGVVDGMPAGITIDVDEVQRQLNRRRPGQSAIVTQRNEKDRVRFLSGIFEGVTTGTPIGFVVENEDHHSNDYSNIRDVFRPSHADYTYTSKYGIRDYRGGGRSSARETIARVVAGALAMQALSQIGVTVTAYTSQVGNIALDNDYRHYDLSTIESNDVRCPDADAAARMHELIRQVQADGDTIGGTVTCVVKGVPVGLGEPVFDKLHARLAYAMMSINAAKGFDYGMGFDGVGNRGSQMNDAFICTDGHISTTTNRSGGIQGGISNGEDIYFRVAFKPVATLLRDVETIDKDGRATTLHARGRHDPCVLPRAVPIVEAMAAMTIFDMYLLNRTARL